MSNINSGRFSSLTGMDNRVPGNHTDFSNAFRFRPLPKGEQEKSTPPHQTPAHTTSTSPNQAPHELLLLSAGRGGLEQRESRFRWMKAAAVQVDVQADEMVAVVIERVERPSWASENIL